MAKENHVQHLITAHQAMFAFWLKGKEKRCFLVPRNVFLVDQGSLTGIAGNEMGRGSIVNICVRDRIRNYFFILFSVVFFGRQSYGN